MLEERIPTDIRPVMSAGAMWATEIKQSRSGHEFRNKRWANPLREYSISFGPRSMDDIQNVMGFTYKTSGAWLGFRLKDWFDFKSCDPLVTHQATDLSLGTGDGSTYYFRLNKTYPGSYTRRIYKPVANTILVAIGGVVQTQGTHYFVDSVNGTVVFKDPPSNGSSLTWGGEFDVPVRFRDDIYETLSQYYASGSTGSISLKELRVREDIDTSSYDAQRAAL